MSWTVTLTKNAVKQQAKLPESVRLVIQPLTEDLKYKGPAPGKEWPTYVACWQVLDHDEKLTEIYYVGTQEKAPY